MITAAAPCRVGGRQRGRCRRGWPLLQRRRAPRRPGWRACGRRRRPAAGPRRRRRSRSAVISASRTGCGAAARCRRSPSAAPAVVASSCCTSAAARVFSSAASVAPPPRPRRSPAALKSCGRSGAAAPSRSRSARGHGEQVGEADGAGRQAAGVADRRRRRAGGRCRGVDDAGSPAPSRCGAVRRSASASTSSGPTSRSRSDDPVDCGCAAAVQDTVARDHARVGQPAAEPGVSQGSAAARGRAVTPAQAGAAAGGAGEQQHEPVGDVVPAARRVDDVRSGGWSPRDTASRMPPARPKLPRMIWKTLSASDRSPSASSMSSSRAMKPSTRVLGRVAPAARAAAARRPSGARRRACPACQAAAASRRRRPATAATDVPGRGLRRQLVADQRERVAERLDVDVEAGLVQRLPRTGSRSGRRAAGPAARRRAATARAGPGPRTGRWRAPARLASPWWVRYPLRSTAPAAAWVIDGACMNPPLSGGRLHRRASGAQLAGSELARGSRPAG